MVVVLTVFTRVSCIFRIHAVCLLSFCSAPIGDDGRGLHFTFRGKSNRSGEDETCDIYIIYKDLRPSQDL